MDKTEASSKALLPLAVACMAYLGMGITKINVSSKELLIGYAAATFIALFLATRSIALAVASVLVSLNTVYFLVRHEYFSDINDQILVWNGTLMVVLIVGLKMIEKKDHKSVAVIGISLMAFNSIIALLPAYI